MANSTERTGVYHCGEIAERNNWTFREQPVSDVGIDAHMEFLVSLNNFLHCKSNLVRVGSKREKMSI